METTKNNKTTTTTARPTTDKHEELVVQKRTYEELDVNKLESVVGAGRLLNHAMYYVLR